MLLNRRGIDDPFNMTKSAPESPQSLTIAEPPIKSSVKQAQTFGNISFSGSHNPFNATQATGDVNVNQASTRTRGEDEDCQSALAALAKLKEQLAATEGLSAFMKKDAAAKIDMLQSELQQPQPDKSFINEVVAALQQGLNRVLTLSEPMAQVATQMARVGRSLR